MKQVFLALVLLFSANFCMAQTRAVTSNGDEVILNEDGTWKYVKDNGTKDGPARIDTNRIRFLKPAGSSFLVKSNKTNVGIYLDPKKWRFTKLEGGKEAEYEFNNKTKDIYGMMISEKIEMPLTTLKMAAVTNAKEAAPDIQVTKEEYRYVNNNLVLMLQMSGTITGIKFTYLGYYYSSPKGTVQLLTYTSTNLLNEYKPEMEEMLNGFNILP
jgi:hypothetical protein